MCCGMNNKNNNNKCKNKKEKNENESSHEIIYFPKNKMYKSRMKRIIEFHTLNVLEIDDEKRHKIHG